MESGSTEHVTILWEPSRPIASLLVRLPVIVLSPALFAFWLTLVIDNHTTGLAVASGIVLLGIITSITVWCVRDSRRVLVSSDTAIGVRVGSKTVFEVPWTDIVGIKLDREWRRRSVPFTFD